MMFRMRQEERADHIYTALTALASPDRPDRLALIGRAAIAINKEDGASALEMLRAAMEGMVLSSRQAVLHLMKAQALMLEGREGEARAARDEYMFLAEKRNNG